MNYHLGGIPWFSSCLRSLSHLCPFSLNNAKIHTYQQTQKIPSTTCKTFPLCMFNNSLRPRSILNRIFRGRLGQGELAKEIKGGIWEGKLLWWSQFWLVLGLIFRAVSFSVLPAQLHLLTRPCSEPCCKNPICTAIVSQIYLYDASREAVSLSFEMPALLTSVSFVLSCPKCLFMCTFAFLQAKLVFLKEKSVDWLHQGHPGEGGGQWLGFRFLNSMPDLRNESRAQEFAFIKEPQGTLMHTESWELQSKEWQTVMDTGQGFVSNVPLIQW